MSTHLVFFIKHFNLLTRWPSHLVAPSYGYFSSSFATTLLEQNEVFFFYLLFILLLLFLFYLIIHHHLKRVKQKPMTRPIRDAGVDFLKCLDGTGILYNDITVNINKLSHNQFVFLAQYSISFISWLSYYSNYFLSILITDLMRRRRKRCEIIN